MTFEDVLKQNKLQIGQQFLIMGLHGPLALKERLLEIGLHEGIRIEYCGRAPFQGPFLFRFSSSTFALRMEEVQCLIIQM